MPLRKEKDDGYGNGHGDRGRADPVEVGGPEEEDEVAEADGRRSDLLRLEQYGGEGKLGPGPDEVIGTEKHIRWVAERLGPLSFANPTLMLATLQSISLADRPTGEVVHPLRRGDRIRMLCPKCRQETSYIV